MSQIRVMVVRPGESPVEGTMVNSLDAMRTIVGGYIDHVQGPGGISLWVNDEGLLLGLPFNVQLGEVVLVGNILVTGSSPTGENIASLTDAQVAAVRQIFVPGPAAGDA